MDRNRLHRLSGPGLLLLAGLALTGCVEAAVGAGATVGTTAMQERGVKGAANDTAIRAEINHYWLEKDHKMWMGLNLQVYERRVLVSGTTPTEDVRAEAIQLAWKAKNVREVINEIRSLLSSRGVALGGPGVVGSPAVSS